LKPTFHNPLEVKSFYDSNDIFKAIKEAQQDLGNPKTVWYRGLPNEKYTLLPTLLRYDNGMDEEKNIFHRYRQATISMPEGRTDDWLTIIDMQHYGVPTRLLDWTDFLGVAVYFAIVPCIYVLDPVALNAHSCGRPDIFFVPEDNEFNFRQVYWGLKPGGPYSSPASPIAIEPICDNKRVLAQKGVFTVHDNSMKPLEETARHAVRKVRLLPKNLRQLEDFLKFANLNETSVFPDIAGVVKYVITSANLFSKSKI
jgi:hypothetical protein